MDVAVSTSDLHAEGLLMENASAEMSSVARQANAGKLGVAENQKNSLESPLRRSKTNAFRLFIDMSDLLK